MTNINRAVSLTSYLVSLPPTSYMILAIILLGLGFGLLIDLGKPDVLHQGAVDGLMLLALPALLSSVVVKILIRKMLYRRIVATALAGEIVYSIAYGISLLLAGVNPLWAQLVIIIGSALVFVLWYVIARFVFILKYRSILFAMIQLLFYLFFLASNQVLYVTEEPFFDVAAKFYISSFVLLAAIVLFFFIINAPMKKSFGIRSTDAMLYFFGQWLYHNKDMEMAFEKVGEPVKTLVSLMAFKRKKDSVFFITPYVHYGPFGNLGGSEFSYLIAKEMDRKYKSRTFVFHGTVTHDLNPVSTSEMKKILNTVDSSLKNAVYKDAKVSISIGSVDECRAETVRVNNSAMIGLTRAPRLTEDINFGLGLSLIMAAQKHVDNAMLIDQHNSETGEITSFEPGSLIGYKYLTATRKSLSQKKPGKPLKIGVATRTIDSEVLGNGGIKVAVISSSPEYVVVLLDSNGVTPKFRGRIEKEIKKIGAAMKRDFTVGVFTTDTHQTNIVRGVLNPVTDEENVLSAIKGACKDAVKDMQPAKFYADTKWFDINVIGAKQSIELISTINSIVAVAKIALPLIILGGLILLIAIVTKL